MNTENVITGKKGNYILVLSLMNAVELIIPKFGDVYFQPGFYFYCGSAHTSGGLESRVTRHLNSKSKLFWHIDYIKAQMHIFEIWCQISVENNECCFSHYFSNQENVMFIKKGFGSSDCKNMCDSHLWIFPIGENIGYFFDDLSKRFEGMFKFYPPAF